MVLVNKINSVLNNIKSNILSRNGCFPGAGLFHYDFQAAGERSRVHLRIDADGSGLLLVNASRIMHLNPTACAMIYLILQKVERDQAIRILSQVYNAESNLIIDDYAQIENLLKELIRPDGACPIHVLDLDIAPPFSTTPSAPYRMDLAVTYRCNNDCLHCYNARTRNYPELSTKEWFKILDLLWDIGIPHIVFTGGEPTLRDDLTELIAHAENNGQITGINTNGRRLSDPVYVERLVNSGLDHVQITLESSSPEIHDAMVNNRGSWKQTIRGIENVLETSLYVMTNTTMLSTNQEYISETIKYLASLGVPTVGLNALIYSGRGASVDTGLAERDLSILLSSARDLTNKHNQRLIWYTPTQYCNFDPMQLELGIKSCTAAMYNMCIEPNGDVIPCQSYYQSLGNILSVPWNRIWNHDLCVKLRERKSLPDKCSGCLLITECGGGCPLIHKSVGSN